MKKLWETTNKNNQIIKMIESYCFAEGTTLDNNLISEDVYGSLAHATMLCKIGILNKPDFKRLRKALIKILELAEKGQFVVEQKDEDVHTKIENFLTQELGVLGEKIHTGRSRNDQVLVDLRLYSKKNIFYIAKLSLQLVNLFLKFAKKYEFIPMPGYTHMQKAMPSSIGMWSGSFAESLLDDLELIKSAYQLNDQSPLGTGAAYGVSLPIDRKLTAKLLGFSKVQNNSLYAQASRPKIQLAIMQALSQIMSTLSRFAQDLLLFTTSEFNFFSVDEELCTGSSIMPQKKNLDVMEYLRAKTHIVISLTNSVGLISSGLPSGYNADFAQTKNSFMQAFEITQQSIEVVNIAIQSIKPNVEILKKACSSELYATHAAYLLVKKGVPFREAYLKIKKNLNSLDHFEPVKILKDTDHIGGPGNLQLDKVELLTSTQKIGWDKEEEKFTDSIKKLKGGENI